MAPYPTDLPLRSPPRAIGATGIVETASSHVPRAHRRPLVRGRPARQGARGVRGGARLPPLAGHRLARGAASTPVARAASRLSLAGAVALGVSGARARRTLFVLTSLAAIAASGAMSPLLTQIYQDNYPDASRGRLFSRTVMIRIVSAATFGAGAGYLLAADIGYFRVLLGDLRRGARVLELVPVARAVGAAPPLGRTASAARVPERARRSVSSARRSSRGCSWASPT
jgi:hypothetical protein